MEPAEGYSLTHAKSAMAIVRAGESASASEAREEERSVTDTAADEMEEHLRGLGYLE